MTQVSILIIIALTEMRVKFQCLLVYSKWCEQDESNSWARKSSRVI